MKKNLYLSLLLTVFSINLFSQEFSDASRTELKNDAGSQGSKSGFFQTENPVNFPAGSSSWWHLLDVRHTSAANNFAMQFAGSFWDQDLYFRKTSNNPAQLWSRVLLESNGMAGIGTTNPADALQIGNYQNNSNKKIVVPGLYNFEQLRIGQYGNGSPAIELINHIGVSQSYGIKFVTNVDEAAGLQIKYTPSASSSYAGLSYTTGFFMGLNGNVGIGTTTPGGYKLAVNGSAIFTRIQVKATSTPWPDYVFHPTYELRSLSSLEAYINQYHHLPDVPSADEVEKGGLDIGLTQALLLRKIEELTLHVIRQEKENKKLKQRVGQLEGRHK